LWFDDKGDIGCDYRGDNGCKYLVDGEHRRDRGRDYIDDIGCDDATVVTVGVTSGDGSECQLRGRSGCD
jgi:hypothetical protein